MKFYITDFSEDNAIDNHTHFWCHEIPKYSEHNIVNNINEADVILFGHVSRTNYKFKEENIGNKPIVIIDYSELESNSLNDHFIGFNISSWFAQFEEWNKLNDWLKSKQNQIKIYFKREFEKKLYHPNIPTYPIEYLVFDSYFWNQQIQNFEDFNKRIFNFAIFFALSSISRPLLVSKMIEKCFCNNMCFDERILECDEYNKPSFINQPGILILYKPHFFRIPHNKMMDLYSKSKIAISLHGAGRKCLKEPEVSFNSVSAIQETNQYYSYPWIDDNNCIVLPNKKDNPFLIDAEKSVDKMLKYIEQPEKLYQIYLNSHKNSLNYRIDNYLTKYIIPKIEGVELNEYISY